MITIYILINKINNKLYVGQTNNLTRRKRQYKKSETNPKLITPIYLAIKKYGWINFSMIEIENYDTANSADDAEIFWIKFLKTCICVHGKTYGYNISFGGTFNREAWKTPEHREKMKQITLSKNLKGENNYNANFKNQEIKELRDKYLSLNFSKNDICAQYSIAYGTIYDILSNNHYYDKEYGDKLTAEFLSKYYEKFAKPNSQGNNKTSIKDNSGNIFLSMKSACEFHSISMNKLRSALQNKSKSRAFNNFFSYII